MKSLIGLASQMTKLKKENDIMADSTNTNNYGVNNIKVMSDMEHLRSRSGMYIGDANNPRSADLRMGQPNRLKTCYPYNYGGKRRELKHLSSGRKRK